jgi:precorrin-8X/cobalt-precorrin-8 methylmutase
MKHMQGKEITRRSFKIIRERLGDFTASPYKMEIVIRIAHTTGDVEFAKTFIFHADPVIRGVNAILTGKNVITDVEMVRTGIRSKLMAPFGGGVLCYLNDEEVVERAKKEETTRSALAMRSAAPAMEGGIIAVGNAPTALFELLEMIRQGIARPAVVVGVPVGFVGALDAKRELSMADIPFITVLSERGGSPIAAAIVNGFIALAGEEKSNE